MTGHISDPQNFTSQTRGWDNLLQLLAAIRESDATLLSVDRDRRDETKPFHSDDDYWITYRHYAEVEFVPLSQ